MAGMTTVMGAEQFAATLIELDAELDWELLGDLYCHDDGVDFFDTAARENLRETGLLFATDVADAIAKSTTGIDAGGPGRSLYVGASVAELGPILCETLVLGREVVWLNLPGPESDELNRALLAVGSRSGCTLPAVRTQSVEVEVDGPCDHLWMASVLTDPDAFPALHDHLYERTDEGATGRGDLQQELLHAEFLVRSFARCLQAPCLVSTTDEELGFVQPACTRKGWGLEVPEVGRLSSVVGDVVRHCPASR